MPRAQLRAAMVTGCCSRTRPPATPGQGSQPTGGCLTGHLLCCRPQSYLGAWEPHSGGPPTRGSISEVQGSRCPGHRARRTLLAPPLGRPQVSTRTPRTGSGLGGTWLAVNGVGSKNVGGLGASWLWLHLWSPEAPSVAAQGPCPGLDSAVHGPKSWRDWLWGYEKWHVVLPGEPLGQKCQHLCGATNPRVRRSLFPVPS